MSLQSILKPNNYDLFCHNLTATGIITPSGIVTGDIIYHTLTQDNGNSFVDASGSAKLADVQAASINCVDVIASNDIGAAHFLNGDSFAAGHLGQFQISSSGLLNLEAISGGNTYSINSDFSGNLTVECIAGSSSGHKAIIGGRVPEFQLIQDSTHVFYVNPNEMLFQAGSSTPFLYTTTSGLILSSSGGPNSGNLHVNSLSVGASNQFIANASGFLNLNYTALTNDYNIFNDPTLGTLNITTPLGPSTVLDAGIISGLDPSGHIMWNITGISNANASFDIGKVHYDSVGGLTINSLSGSAPKVTCGWAEDGLLNRQCETIIPSINNANFTFNSSGSLYPRLYVCASGTTTATLPNVTNYATFFTNRPYLTSSGYSFINYIVNTSPGSVSIANSGDGKVIMSPSGSLSLAANSATRTLVFSVVDKTGAATPSIIVY